MLIKLIRLSILSLLLFTAACSQDAADTAKDTKAQSQAVAENKAEAEQQASTTDSQQETAPVQEKDAAEQHNHEHSAHEHSANPLAGIGWQEIEPQFECDKPVVMEFFAYQCPHCYELEPYAQKWHATYQGDAEFIQIPTHLGRQEFGAYLIVHHAAKKLGLIEMATPKLFDRVHKERKLFTSEQDAVDFLVSLGADEKAAREAVMDQEAVNAAVNQDFTYMQKYKITGVPTVIVNHQYKTDVTMAGGYDKVFEQVDKMLALPSKCQSH